MNHSIRHTIRNQLTHLSKSGLAYVQNPQRITMASKWKHEDEKLPIYCSEDLRRLLSSAISTHETAEMAVLWLMRKYRFDLSLLRSSLRDEGLMLNLSEVKFHDIAGIVGLRGYQKLEGIRTFNLYRSRIPTKLFRSIVEDMDVLLTQYGPLPDQMNEETRSCFLAPIFNRLIAVFSFAFRNSPESTIEGRIATQGRIKHYFKAFNGPISVIFLQVKFKMLGYAEERLHAIAQLIAECNVCDWNNATEGFHAPIIGIFCDGMSFEFFSFDRSNSPKFTRGCLPGDPRKFHRGIQLIDFTSSCPALFIAGLRQICEIIFDLLMGSYISSLTAYCDQYKLRGMGPRQNLKTWDEAQALKHAQEALKKFRAAETKRSEKHIKEANALVEEAMKVMKLSMESSPIHDQMDLIMTGWNDKKIEKV